MKLILDGVELRNGSAKEIREYLVSEAESGVLAVFDHVVEKDLLRLGKPMYHGMTTSVERRASTGKLWEFAR